MQAYDMKISGVEWQGLTPRHWRKDKLYRLCKKMGSGGTPSSTNEGYYGGNIPWIQSGDLTDSYVSYTKKSITDEALASSSAKIFSKGTLLVAMYGATIGKLGIMEMDAATNQACCSLLPSSKFSTKFLYYLMLDARQFLLNEAYGGGQPNISQETLKQLHMVVPDPEEQKAISDYLDKACEKIDQTLSIKQQQLDKLEAYRKSITFNAVTKGLDNNVPMKDSDIQRVGIIPKHWKVTKIKRITEIARGKFNHRPRNDPDYYNGEYPFIQTGDITNAKKFIKTYSQTLNEKGFSVSKSFPQGTLTMTIAANVGDVAILEFEACFPDSVLGFKPLYMAKVEYLYYLFLGLNDDVLSTAIVTTQLNLNIVRVGTVPCGLPPLKEQDEIISKLKEMDQKVDSLVDNVGSQIEILKKYRQSLIHECVTGKKRIYQSDNN